MKKHLFLIIIISFLGSIFYLLFGWLVFDVLFGDYTENHTTHLQGFKKSRDFSVLFLYLSCLSYAFLINIFLFKSTISKYGSAFMHSSVFGILIACMTDFFWYASSNFYDNFTVVILDVLGAAISVGFLGLFSFFLHQKFSLKS